MKVRIADDAAEVRFLREEFVEMSGNEAVTATNGSEAWETMCSPDPPGVAALDWVMSGITGVELTRKIKESADRGFTYVILVTGKEDARDKITALDAGADDFLSKPVDPREFVSRLRVGIWTARLENE